MKKMVSLVLVLMLSMQTFPVFSLTQIKNTTALKDFKARELTLLEMKHIRGGKTTTSSGPDTDKKVSGIPHINQFVSEWSTYNGATYEDRSYHYCAYACNSMITKWKNTSVPWTSYDDHLMKLDRDGCSGRFFTSIDVYNGGGFLYHGSESNSTKMSYSKWAVEDLFYKEAGLYPDIYVGNWYTSAANSIWDEVENYSNPSLSVVVEGSPSAKYTLHYILVTGIYQNSSRDPKKYYVHDPLVKPDGDGAYERWSKEKLQEKMYICDGYHTHPWYDFDDYDFSWVSDYLSNGETLYAFLD